MLATLSAWPNWLVTFWDQWHVLIRIALIVVLSVIARWVLLISVRRVVRGVVSGVKSRNKNRQDEAENSPLAAARLVQRTQTMGSVLDNFITWSIALFSLTMVLGELGVQIGALAAGAGLIGAGVGFGAQALIRDLISGLFIVFEDQYGVGDNVNLGEVSGVVEAVGLRATQLRDDNGVLWYVRNGEIVKVGNQSQGWSRAIVDIALLPDADWLKAKSVLESAVAEFSNNKAVETNLIGQASVWGIHALNGDQTVLRVVQQTKANTSDEVSRELRALVKQTLDKAKIELAPERASVLINKK